MDLNIFKQTLAVILRHFLSIMAGALGTWGVSAGMQSQLVEAVIAVLVSVVFAGVALVLSYAEKKFSNQVKEAALQASPSTTMAAVIESVEKINGGTI